MTLDQLHIDQVGTVGAILPDQLSGKLVEMGLFKGKEVKLVFKAPLGDPIAVELDGCLLSLRRKEAALIELL